MLLILTAKLLSIRPLCWAVEKNAFCTLPLSIAVSQVMLCVFMSFKKYFSMQNWRDYICSWVGVCLIKLCCVVLITSVFKLHNLLCIIILVVWFFFCMYEDLLKGIFFEVKKKFETALGVLKKEKITIDPDDPAAVSRYAQVMKTVRQK